MFKLENRLNKTVFNKKTKISNPVRKIRFLTHRIWTKVINRKILAGAATQGSGIKLSDPKKTNWRIKLQISSHQNLADQIKDTYQLLLSLKVKIIIEKLKMNAQAANKLF